MTSFLDDVERMLFQQKPYYTPVKKLGNTLLTLLFENRDSIPIENTALSAIFPQAK